MKSKDFALEKDEISKLIKACENDKEKFLIKGLVFTGMRIGEFLHLNKGWIKRGFIVIPRKEKCGKCGYCRQKKTEYQLRIKNTIKDPRIIERLKREDNFLNGWWIPKTEEASRSIPLVNKDIENTLREFFETYQYPHQLYDNRVNTWNMCKRVGRRINKKITPHALRSTFASRLAQEGISPANLQGVMGWTSIITAISYVRASGAPAKDEMDRLGIGKRFI